MELKLGRGDHFGTRQCFSDRCDFFSLANTVRQQPDCVKTLHKATETGPTFNQGSVCSMMDERYFCHFNPIMGSSS